MKIWKQRLAVLLCVAMTLTSVIVCTPKENVQAATTTYNFYVNYLWQTERPKVDDTSIVPLAVGKGTKDLYLNCLASCGKTVDDTYIELDVKKQKGITYYSSDESILSIGKDSKVTPKKLGRVVVCVKFHDQKRYGIMEVVDPQIIKNASPANLVKGNKIAQKIFTTYDGKITKDNRFKLIPYGKQFGQTIQDDGIAYYGEPIELTDDFGNTYTDYIYRYCVYETKFLKVKQIYSELGRESQNVNAFSTRDANHFVINSVKGSGTTVTATLTKKVSQDQLFSVEYLSRYFDDVKLGNKKTATFHIYLVDPRHEDKVIPAIATIKTGSKTISIKTDSKLKKGTTYELIQYAYYDADYDYEDWIHEGKYKFKAS